MAEAFQLKDATLITRMGGVEPAMNLRELRERLRACPAECLYHHFCETVLRPTFDDPEFRNDLALWASRDLHDRILAERLGILNPYRFDGLEALRAELVDICDERLSEVPMVPWVRRGHEFRFMRAATVIFSTGHAMRSPADLPLEIPRLSYGSIYYHFVEARRRTPDRVDDFSQWLRDRGDAPAGWLDALGRLDFYFMSLAELKTAVAEAVGG